MQLEQFLSLLPRSSSCVGAAGGLTLLFRRLTTLQFREITVYPKPPCPGLLHSKSDLSNHLGRYADAM